MKVYECCTPGCTAMVPAMFCDPCNRKAAGEDASVGRRRRQDGALVLELPLPPNMANGRLHWRAKNRERLKYLEGCSQRWMAGLLHGPPRKPPLRACLRATLYVWNRMDYDNAMARLKWPVDWLVSAGYIEDDDAEHLEWDGLPKQVIDRKRQRIVFVLEAA